MSPSFQIQCARSRIIPCRHVRGLRPCILASHCCLLLLLLGPVLAAQQGTVIGTVRDADTELPLAGANVSLRGTSLGTATATDGMYVLDGVPEGERILVVSHLGYATRELPVTVQAGQAITADVRLNGRPVTISEVVIERDMLIGDESGISDIPGAAHVITKQTLRKHSYGDINRVLRDIPGLNIQEEDGFGLRPNIGMRGTVVERSQKISLMEDGVLIAPAPYAAPAAYYIPTIGRMEGVEVRKGSSQIKYGPYTTGGALNMISTRIPASFQGRVNLSAGDHQTRTLHATAGDSYKNVAFVAESWQSRSDGFKVLDNNAGTGFDKQDYLAKLRFNTDFDAPVYQDLVLKISQTNETSDETYLGLTDADFNATPYRRYAASQRDQMNTAHRQYQLRHFIKPSRNFDVTTTAYRNSFTRNWYKLDKVFAGDDGESTSIAALLADPERHASAYDIITGAADSGDDALNVKANNREYYSRGIQSILGMRFERETILHEVEVGLRYHRDEEDRFQWQDQYAMTEGTMKLTTAGTPGTESNRISQATAWAAFLQYRITIGRLALTPGIRYEDIHLQRNDYGKNDPQRSGDALKLQSNMVSAFIPGLGVNYRFTDAISGFVSVHRGFSPPGFREGTRPEESMNYEIGGRYQQFLTNLQLVFFMNNYNNLLGVDLAAGGGTGSGDLFNGGAVDVHGLEVSARHDLLKSAGPQNITVPLRLAYTYTDAAFGSDFESDFADWGEVRSGDALPYVANHQFSIGSGIETGTWGLDVSVRYVGQMRTQAGSGPIPDGQSTDAQLVFDGVLDYQLTTASRLFFALRNITDQTYVVARRPAGARPGLPRTMLLGLQMSF